MSRIIFMGATSKKALCVFLLINLATTLGHQLEDLSSIGKIRYHQSQSSSIKGPKFPCRKIILHGIESVDGTMVKDQEGGCHSDSSEAGTKSSPSAGEILDQGLRMRDGSTISRSELKGDVVDNGKLGIRSSEIRKEARLLIEEHADRSRELDRGVLYRSRTPNSDHSDCTHVGIGVCPPVPALRGEFIELFEEGLLD